MCRKTKVELEADAISGLGTTLSRGVVGVKETKPNFFHKVTRSNSQL